MASNRKWKALAKQLNLGNAGWWATDNAIEDFIKGDGASFVENTENGCQMALFLDNTKLLRQRGIYEAALVSAMVAGKHNWSNWPVRFLQCLLDTGNREAIRAAGSPLPGPGPFTVYRGVAGTGSRRRVRGLSWTVSLDVACWFALRFETLLGDPDVYVAKVAADDVWYYCEERNEQEIVCRPRSYKRLNISLDDMKAAQSRVTEAKQVRQEAEFAAIKAKRKAGG